MRVTRVVRNARAVGVDAAMSIRMIVSLFFGILDSEL
jgi:hypothetical protein